MREGLTEKEDWLPPRMFQPQNEGPIPDTVVDPRKLGKAKKTYYRMMGWDEDTGVPTVGKLEELDIPWVAKHLVNVLPHIKSSRDYVWMLEEPETE